MDIVLEPFDEANRAVVERLWQLYRHDLSEMTGALPDAEGRYPARRLPRYFEGACDAGFLARSGTAAVGFCTVMAAGPRSSLMGEFFVVRAARRHGVGSAMASRLLAARPGGWSVPFQSANRPAAAFWRGVANAAAGTAWTEDLVPVHGEPAMPPDVWLRFTVAP